MFENLQSRFAAIFNKLRSGSRVDERTVKEAVREVRLAFLEADVNYQATREFCRKIEEKALGAEVLSGLAPGQQVIKIVHDVMVDLLGGPGQKLTLMTDHEERIMLVGLQGSGKTTTAAKLASRLKEEGRKPLLVAGDIHRPAAVKQLEVVGQQVGIPVFSMGTDVEPAKIAKEGTKKAQADGLDTIILDTAGRLHIDEEMMEEVKRVRESWRPSLTLLVVDAMVGQDAVNQAKHFHENLDLDGTILTKLDGDTRGGAAISVRHVTAKPIYFAGVGPAVRVRCSALERCPTTLTGKTPSSLHLEQAASYNHNRFRTPAAPVTDERSPLPQRSSTWTKSRHNSSYG